MEPKKHFDFWYAVNNTEVVHMPTRHLETFGATTLNYHLVSELMDNTSQVRVREGRMLANQPKIITPEAYAKTYLEGFGDEAAKYVEWLREHDTDVRILQYGYTLRQQSYSEQLLTDHVKNVVERVRDEVKRRQDPLDAVVVGVDDPWDVCLVKLFWEVIRHSARTNIMQMEKRHMFNKAESSALRVRQEIEAAFLKASRNSALIGALAHKLQEHGLLEEYQDRFFALVKASKQG